MDDLAFIAHVVGGKELEQKLRDKGFTGFQSLVDKEPVQLARELEISEEMAQKIIDAVRAAFSVEPSEAKEQLHPPSPEEGENNTGTTAMAAGPHPEPLEEGLKQIQQEKLIRRKRKVVAAPRKRKQVFVKELSFRKIPPKRYWRFVLPVLGVVLLVSLFNR